IPLEPVLGLSSLQQPVGTHWGARPGTAVNLCVSLRVPQAVPMDLRIGQRFVKPGSDTALLALKQTQQLQHQLFLASLHQQQVEQFTHQHMRVGTPSRASGGPQGQAPGCGDTSHQQPLGRPPPGSEHSCVGEQEAPRPQKDQAVVSDQNSRELKEQ
uniref:Histone deacetylase n=1 Tax=Terrapene triunguis TaxID=2587831 RepID=A0A674K1C3_9SAUR